MGASLDELRPIWRAAVKANYAAKAALGDERNAFYLRKAEMMSQVITAAPQRITVEDLQLTGSGIVAIWVSGLSGLHAPLRWLSPEAMGVVVSAIAKAGSAKLRLIDSSRSLEGRVTIAVGGTGPYEVATLTVAPDAWTVIETDGEQPWPKQWGNAWSRLRARPKDAIGRSEATVRLLEELLVAVASPALGPQISLRDDGKTLHVQFSDAAAVRGRRLGRRATHQVPWKQVERDVMSVDSGARGGILARLRAKAVDHAEERLRDAGADDANVTARVTAHRSIAVRAAGGAEAVFSAAELTGPLGRRVAVLAKETNERVAKETRERVLSRLEIYRRRQSERVASSSSRSRRGHTARAREALVERATRQAFMISDHDWATSLATATPDAIAAILLPGASEGDRTRVARLLGAPVPPRSRLTLGLGSAFDAAEDYWCRFIDRLVRGPRPPQQPGPAPVPEAASVPQWRLEVEAMERALKGHAAAVPQ